MIKGDRVCFFSAIPQGIFWGTIASIICDEVVILTDSPFPVYIIIKNLAHVAKDCRSPERLYDTI